jgi:hypothetical protein
VAPRETQPPLHHFEKSVARLPSANSFDISPWKWRDSPSFALRQARVSLGWQQRYRSSCLRRDGATDEAVIDPLFSN